MTETKHCSFLINVNKENKIKCSIINEQNEEILIKINDTQKEEYLPITIEFDMNEILIGKTTENTIIFMEEWMTNPTEFKKYKISYQGKEEEVIAEVLFALLINKFKKKIEKDYIIDEVIVEIAQQIYKSFILRLTTSIESLGLKNIEINPLENEEYQTQGEILHTILSKKRRIQ